MVVLDTGSLQEYIFHSPVKEGDTQEKVFSGNFKRERRERGALLPATLIDELTNRGHPGVLMQCLPVCRTNDHLHKKLTYTSTP